MRRQRRVAAIGAAALILATVGLFLVSRGKWSDAIIDSGREWIVPDALARGDLLYRDVVYWFGPFTPYFHATFFRLFGSSFQTLVVAGVVGSFGVLAALYFALTTVTRRREATLWTALAVPALIFMPNGGGAILGMGYRIWHAAAFGMASIALASRPSDRRPILRAAGVGALSALAGLCRTEWGLVAAAASLCAILFRERSARARLRGTLAGGAAFLLLFGGTLAAFIAAAGWKAVIEDGHVLLTGLPPETRTFLVAYSGVRDWPAGVLELLYSSAMWAGALLLIQILAIGRRDRTRVLRRLPLLVNLFFILILTSALGGAGGAVLFSAAPLVCLVATAVALGRATPSGAGLLGFGIAGIVLSYRRPFHIGDSAYVGPPLLFAFVCAAALIQQIFERERDAFIRKKFRAYLAAAVFALAALAFLGRAFRYSEDERIPISGTQGMLSARPEQLGKLELLTRDIRRESASGEGLVVFPEGEVLNYLAGRLNPIRHKLLIPGYLNNLNETEVLTELERTPPKVVVVLPRQTGEYGLSAFGVNYGVQLRRWVERNFKTRDLPTEGALLKRIRPWAVFAVRK